MFSEMLSALHTGRRPDADTLGKRYDYAMTKKLGVVKLPPAFWTEDPKINPPVEQLFWAALLLLDRERIDLALSVMAVETAEKKPVDRAEASLDMEDRARELVGKLLKQFADPRARQEFARDLHSIVPEMLDPAIEKP